MSAMNYYNNFETDEDFDKLYQIRNTNHRKDRDGRNKSQGKRTPPSEITKQLSELAEDLATMNFTYTPSRHERTWIVNSLKKFFDQQWLDDILCLVKGGKEANVYQCLVNSSVIDVDAPYLAAKIYRPRRFRNLKNDQLYREGRMNLDSDGNEILDDGKLHAMAKKTEFGRELLHTSWIEHEVKTMQLISAAGGDVPKVFASENNAILMSYIGDLEMAAPILYSVRLGKKEARRLFERVIQNVELMLAQNRVHADLSAFNILYWDGEITLIDFPQSIDPRINRNAYRIFERDVRRVCEYFARQGVESDPGKLALNLWKAQHLRIVPDVHPGLLNSENDADQVYWQSWLEEID